MVVLCGVSRSIPVLALLTLLSASASAQLQVSTPGVTPCGPDTVPVLGIALDMVMDGTYGLHLSNDLEKSLQKQGFRVVPDYTHGLVDLATIGVRGEADYWENSAGEQSANRIGDAHIVIYDLETKRTLYDLNQTAKTWVFGAPKSQEFLNSVANVFKEHFCQLDQ